MISISALKLREEKSRSTDIELAKGSINVVLGRNRSGKTDFCRFLAGLPTGASASIAFDGRLFDAGDSEPLSAALVYQAFVNYPHWTVAENIASPMLARGVRDPERVQVLADLMQIGDLLDRLPNELSGGQQQRLAIARALAKSPSLLVMDEPFVNIDYKLRELMLVELRALTSETGICLVYATSDPGDAISLADQLLLIDDYEIIQAGDPLSLYRHPVNFRAADLMSNPGINRFSDSEFVRPEHIRVVDEEDGTGLCTSAVITGVETNGAETFLHADVSVPAGDLTWVSRQPGMLDVVIGDEKKLRVDNADLLIIAEAGV